MQEVTKVRKVEKIWLKGLCVYLAAFFVDEHHIEPSTSARKPKFLAISHDLLALIAKILHGVHEQRKVCFSVAGHFVIYCVHVFKQNQRRSVTLAITEHASKGLRRGSSAAFLRQNHSLLLSTELLALDKSLQLVPINKQSTEGTGHSFPCRLHQWNQKMDHVPFGWLQANLPWTILGLSHWPCLS